MIADTCKLFVMISLILEASCLVSFLLGWDVIVLETCCFFLTIVLYKFLLSCGRVY